MNPAANRDMRQNAAAVATIANHNRRISIIAQSILRIPKKISDHAAFNTSWIAKTNAAIRTSRRLSPLDKTIASATPMSTYKIGQTTPNTQPGGL